MASLGHTVRNGPANSPPVAEPNPTWDVEETRRRMENVIARHGPWTAHNVHLGYGISPLGPGPTPDDQKLRRITRVVGDCLRRPLAASVRILDLGCLEGLYAVEFARQGAEVVAIEGRQSNLAKVQLAKEAWRLDRLTLVEDDVRNLSVERYGAFDVVLCLGLLYHLSVPDVFEFTEQVTGVCRALAVFDTHVSLEGEEQVEYQGQVYRGHTFQEHATDSTQEERLSQPWSSLDNETSFWLTRQSLFLLLERSGFSSAYECTLPQEPDKPTDRLTILALKESMSSARSPSCD